MNSHFLRCGPTVILALLLSGCNVAKPAPIEVSARSGLKSGIKRSEGVPDGVLTTVGLTVPRGFQVEQLAEGFGMPRRLAIAPGGTAKSYDLFVTESGAGRVSVLQVKGKQVAARSVYVSGLNKPYGLAFLESRLYVGNTDAVVSFPYSAGALTTTQPPQKITDLTQGGYNQHWTRNLLASGSGKQIFVTVGSSCNTCEEFDPQRAAISVLSPDGSGKKLFATGMRNPIGLAYRPGTKELWSVVNERDNLGDDIPPDYLTQVHSGAFYGWPYAYTDIDGQIHPDPNFGDINPGLVRETKAPDVPLQAHSAALGLAFYPLHGGNFPKDYAGDAFVSLHGSWNRSAKTGYKIVRVHFEKGRAKSVSDFLVGFEKDNAPAWGRPVDVQVAPDGSMLFSDDGGGKVWRVWYGSAGSLSPKVETVP